MLHEEKPLFSPEAPPEKPTFFFEPPKSMRPPSAKPSIAKIETPADNTEKKEENVRVVHYSDFRTPLDTDAKDKKWYQYTNEY